MRNATARRVSMVGMLFALAIVFGIFESMLTPILGLPPGVKLGLSNVVVLYALYFLGRQPAILLVFLKAGFAFLTRGATAGALSFAGGILSFLVMMLLLLPQKQPSVLIISIAGSLAHNLGQFGVASFLFKTAILVYAPILLASGVVMGFLTAISFRVIVPALEKTGLTKKNDTKKDKDIHRKEESSKEK